MAKVKHVLEGNVASVRSSSTLETSVARLVADENGNGCANGTDDAECKILFQRRQKVSEVNAKHPLIKC